MENWGKESKNILKISKFHNFQNWIVKKLGRLKNWRNFYNILDVSPNEFQHGNECNHKLKEFQELLEFHKSWKLKINVIIIMYIEWLTYNF